ncbi:hypothetical protein EK21DRAFT_115465 [Setomelanomma holmii]|uniref:Uncharacterized protein n=1 Tax=Setomelanomma holmii TaxID=210430 RepID=A0A9P4H3D4_9PLEO|nr:hypothetical protein EK21DRAFT_115465 [Setomelanomma holmii]
MNATTLCETTPNQLLFGDGEAACCAQADEPFQLAAWTGNLCNGSEWRQQFDICGGMACPDWREWIMPWNWTVQNSSLPSDQQVCKPPSQYLAIYAGEQFFWLFTTFAFGFLRLWIAKHEEANNRSIFRWLLVSTWANLRSRKSSNEITKEKFLPDGEHLRPSFTDPLKWGYPVMVGIFLAGLQLGFNFWVAHLIQDTPGYSEVPLAMLALLFCCRPRLSWLSCLLALTPARVLERKFKFKHNGDGIWAAKLVLSSVAVSSAVTEAIMQLLGAYFLGIAANVGRQRGFYTIHHLRPKRWGRNARRIYLGALYWVMLCIPLLVAWFVVAFFFAQIFHAVAGWRRNIFNFLKTKREQEKVPKLAEGTVEWLLDYIGPEHDANDDSFSHADTVHDQPTEYYQPDLPLPYKPENPFQDQPTQYNGPASGHLFNDHDQPIPVRHDSRRSRYSQLTQHSEFNDQPLLVYRSTANSSREVPAGHTHTPSSVQRRTTSGSQYNSIAQSDNATLTPTSAHAFSPAAAQRRTGSGGRYNLVAQNDDLETIDVVDQPTAVSRRSPLRHEVTRPNHRDTSSATLLEPTNNARDEDDPPASSGNSASNKRSDYNEQLALKRANWEWKIIIAGAFLGMLAYAAQWVFWDGFVKTAGDRFCPPNPWKNSMPWLGGAFLYVGAPIMAY